MEERKIQSTKCNVVKVMINSFCPVTANIFVMTAHTMFARKYYLKAIIDKIKISLFRHLSFPLSRKEAKNIQNKGK